MTHDAPGLERLREAFLRPAAGAAAAGPCPRADELLAAACGRGVARQRRAVLAHAALCPACSTAWSVVRDVRGTVRHGGTAARAGFRYPLVVAASLALVLVLFPLLRRGVEAPPPAEWRSSGAGLDWSEVPDEVELTPGEAELRWPAVEAGARYDVLVSDAELEPVAAGVDLDEPRFRLPPDVVSERPEGALLLWQVTVRLPDGRRFVSPTFRARLRAPGR